MVAATSASIKAAVDEATRRLARTPTATPRLDAEVLMDFLLGWPRARLFAHWDENLTDGQRHRYAELVERRAAGEPVAYIRQLKEFQGLELYVDRRVLIPRPETELLVARAVQWLAHHSPARVVDVGTGSGAVAIAIALACPGIRPVAVDSSAGALEVAALNAGRYGVELDLRLGSLLEPVEGPIDLVVANLPYLSRDEYEGLLGTSLAFEPREALTDEADGLRLYDGLLAQAAAKLAPGGGVMLELGAAQAEALAELVSARLPGCAVTIERDYSGWPRVAEVFPRRPEARPA